MERRIFGIFILSFLIFTPFLSFSEEANGEGVDLGGFVDIDKRIDISDGVSNGNTYGKLRVEGKYAINPEVFSLASTEFRYYYLPLLKDLPFVEPIESNYPVDVLLWEAYAEITPFLLDDLDLKVGKQRIAWGTADKFNPTDNLNPNDLTDFFDFEAKIPSLSVKASYYLGDNTITGVWIPFFEPALFPSGGTTFILGQVPSRVVEPARTFDNSMFGLKFSGAALNIDYSLSYFKGFDDIPIAVDLEPSEGPVLGFPEIQVLGFDFAGEFRSVGFWGETALFFPEEIKIGSNVILSDEPYLKFTFGMDYTFNNGIYLEVQYTRGFFTEKGRDDLTDFLLLRIEKNFYNDDMTLSLSGGPGAKDLNEIKDSYGIALVPEISYRPYDNLELSMGMYLFDGEAGNFFGNLKDQDQFYFELRHSF